MMYLDMFSSDAQTIWKAALRKGSPASRHFLLMVIVFNLLNLSQLAVMVKRNHNAPDLGFFIILVVFLLSVLGSYAAQFYRTACGRMASLPEDSTEGQLLARISYLGYRLYLMGLGIGFVTLSFFNIAH